MKRLRQFGTCFTEIDNADDDIMINLKTLINDALSGELNLWDFALRVEEVWGFLPDEIKNIQEIRNLYDKSLVYTPFVIDREKWPGFIDEVSFFEVILLARDVVEEVYFRRPELW